MFEQSLTYALLLRIKSFFALYRTSATHELFSLVVSFLKRLYASYNTSRTKKVIYGFAAYIQKLFHTSITRRFFLCDSAFEKMYGSSLFYNLTSRVVSWFLSVPERLVPFFKKCLGTGYTAAACRWIRSFPFVRFEYMLGAFFAIMMVFPGKVWNNIYAVGGAFLFAFLYYVSRISGSRFSVNTKGIPLSLIAFLVSILGGALMSPVLSDGVRIALFFISSIVFSLLICGSIDDAEHLKGFVTIITSALFAMCLYAIYQTIVGVPVDFLLTDIYTNAGMPGRAYSTFDNPNNFAEAIVLVIPFLYALIICAKDKRGKAIFAIMFAVCLIALGTTYSRSCYVAFAIATVVFAIMYDWRLLIPLFVIVVVAIPFLPQSVFNRILTIGSMNDTSNSYRIYLWDGVLKLARLKWLTGVGIGPEAFTASYKPFAHIFAAKAPHSHMLYLELLVELGVVGAMSFLVFIFGAIKKGLGVISGAKKELKCTIIACISALCGISFTACAEYIWFYPRVMFVFWIVVGVLLCAVRCARKQNKN